MKRIFLFIIILLLGNISSKAGNIIGGEFSVAWNGGNSYHIKLNYFRDCQSTQNFQSPIPIGIYDLETNAIVDSFCMTLGTQTTLQLGDTCYRPDSTQLCVELGVYETDVVIPNDANGLYIAYSRCCRDANIMNIQNAYEASEVLYAEFPNHNSTPEFESYPKGYMCVNNTNIQDFSATDADDDSLVYSLVTPLNGDLNATTVALNSSCAQFVTGAKNIPDPGPYAPIVWQSPYSALNMISGSMSIDPNTGILTAIPTDTGIFVFGILVEEYDRATKTKLGDVHRDVQYHVLSCPGASEQVFISPTKHNYNIAPNDTLSFSVIVRDTAQADSIILTGTSTLFTNGTNTTFLQPVDSQTNVQSNFIFIPSCSDTGTYHVTFTSQKTNCYGTDTVNYDLDIIVTPCILGIADFSNAEAFSLYPNPATNELAIQTSSLHANEAVTVSIMNMLGEVILSRFLSFGEGKDEVLDVSRLAAGMYFVQLKLESGSVVKKFVKE